MRRSAKVRGELLTPAEPKTGGAFPLMVRVATELPLAAEVACALAQKPATFQHLVWPVITTGRLPERVEVGEEVDFRLWFFGFLPAWVHHLRLVSIGPREIFTNEHGGMVRTWNHRLTFEPISDHSCRYTDEIEI